MEALSTAAPAKSGRRRLSDRQRRMLDYIVDYKTAHDGLSPTLREIGAGCDISSTWVVNYNLERLVAAGRISRPARQSRAIQVTGGGWSYRPPDAENGGAGPTSTN